MKVLFFIITFIFCLNLNAQINFEEHIIIDESISVNDLKSVVSVDIDGDGDKDIVSATYADRKIAWYENLDGQGNFGTQNLIATMSTSARVSSMRTADIDNDGDMDIIFSSDNGDFVAWIKNTDGLGNFSNVLVIATQLNGANSVFAQDIDGDGDLDILSTSFLDYKIAWFENLDGLGTFGDANIISSQSTSVISVVSYDIDGDNDMDVIAIAGNVIQWYKNLDGLGNFGPKNTISASYAESITVNDFDNDGDLDLAIAKDSNDRIAWFENLDGLGMFSEEQNISTTALHAQSVFSIDIDNDGDIDILSASRNDNKIAWYENTDGLGNFSTEQIISTTAYGAKVVYADDMNGDGNIDIISGSNYDDKIVWYKNINGLQQFEEQDRVTQSAFKPSSIFAADLDGDGDKDVLSASWADDKIAWYENLDGYGNFGLQKIITTDTDYAKSVYAADLDNDGDMDVISASYSDYTIAWYENIDGQGNFGPQQIIIDTEIGVNLAYAVDIDNDGDMDIISSSGSGIAYFINMDGQGQFSARQSVSNSNFQRYAPVVADFDGDGDLDIASTGEYSGASDELAWYENTDGLLTFDKHLLTTNIDGANATIAADVDLDGDIDIIAAAYNKIALYDNTTGAGNFGSEQLLTVDYLHDANSLNFVDMDLDGLKDIVYGLAGDDKIVWKKQIHSYYFGPTQVIGENAIDVQSVYTADIDGDGDMDVVASSIGDNKIAWYKNSAIILGVETIESLNFTIYPNPTHSIVHIVSKTDIQKIEVYNHLGQIVLSNHDETTIDISNLNSGIYFVKIKDHLNQVETKKVVKK